MRRGPITCIRLFGGALLLVGMAGTAPASATDFGQFRPGSMNSPAGRAISRNAITNTYRGRPPGAAVPGREQALEENRQR